jgi:hypothetical protein
MNSRLLFASTFSLLLFCYACVHLDSIDDRGVPLNWVAGTMHRRADATNAFLLVNPRRSLMARYVENSRLFKCPSDESEHVRSVAMNCRLNPVRLMSGKSDWILRRNFFLRGVFQVCLFRWRQGGFSGVFASMFFWLHRQFSFFHHLTRARSTRSTSGTGASHVWTGMVLANLLAVAGFTLFWRVVRDRLGARTAWWACAFLFLFPGSLFFHFVYSKALFFFLVMLMVAGLERHRYGVAWTAALLLPLTRAIGLFSIVPLAWHLFARRWDGLRGKNTLASTSGERPSSPRPSPPSDGGEGVGSVKLWWKRRWKEWVAVFSGGDFVLRGLVVMAAPILGLGLYFGLMGHWTGNPFEGFEAQKTWKAHSIGNLFDVPAFVAAYFSPIRWHAFRGSLLDRCVFVLLVCTLPVIWRLDKGWFFWALVLGVIPAMSGHFVSYTRFAAVTFPMFIGFIGGLGVLMVMVRRRATLLFPVVLLATVFVVHHLNRPFWSYYWLHFAAPLAWLGAMGLRELFDWFWNSEKLEWKGWLMRRSWALLLWSAALSLALTSAPLKVLDEWRRMRLAPRVEEDVLLQELAAWRHRANWIYTPQVIYAFHARIPVPPELAVVPRKRFASAQIDQAGILQIVKRYEPEILLLFASGLDREWREYLESRYKPIERYAHLRIFVRSDLSDRVQR